MRTSNSGSKKKKMPVQRGKDGKTTLSYRIVSLRDRGFSYHEIGDETGASQAWIWSVLRKWGRVEPKNQKKKTRSKK